MNGQQGRQPIVLTADGMETSLAARVRRLFGLVVAAAALALLLGGLAADPAAAKTREEARTEANDFILACFGSGGEPGPWTSTVGVEKMVVACAYDNGSVKVCEFLPTTSCHFIYSFEPRQAPNHVVDEGTVLDDGGAANEVNHGRGGGVPAGEAAAQR